MPPRTRKPKATAEETTFLADRRSVEGCRESSTTPVVEEVAAPAVAVEAPVPRTRTRKPKASASVEASSAEPTAPVVEAPTAPAVAASVVETPTTPASEVVSAEPVNTTDPNRKVDICFAFDTTGSMSGCIRQVTNNIQDIVKELFKNVPNVRISIVAFQDFNFSYIWKPIDFTNDEGALIHFMKNLDSQYCVTGEDIKFTDTNDSDLNECYEYVMHRVPELNWSSDSMRALVMIGDAPPHEPQYAYKGISWREETQRLKRMGVNIYSVECYCSCLARENKEFYGTIARETNGYHLRLDQFTMIPAMMMAICYKQMGQERLQSYENELRVRDGGVTHGMQQVFDVMLGKKTSEDVDRENRSRYDYGSSYSSSYTRSSSSSSRRTGLEEMKEEDFTLKPSPPGRFQTLPVAEDQDIQGFAESNGLTFERGKGFYEFNKPELIQKTKEIVLLEKSTGLFYEGNKARKMLNLVDYDEKKRIKPSDLDAYKVFIQSTSMNRKLVGGTTFLYDSA
jgi:hypothetical protein